MAEGLGAGLQNLPHQFDPGPGFMERMLMIEETHDLINDVICTCARITLLFGKGEPEKEDKIYIELWRTIALALYNEPTISESTRSMKKVIDIMMPVLKELMEFEGRIIEFLKTNGSKDISPEEG